MILRNFIYTLILGLVLQFSPPLDSLELSPLEARRVFGSTLSFTTHPVKLFEPEGMTLEEFLFLPLVTTRVRPETPPSYQFGKVLWAGWFPVTESIPGKAGRARLVNRNNRRIEITWDEWPVLPKYPHESLDLLQYQPDGNPLQKRENLLPRQRSVTIDIATETKGLLKLFTRYHHAQNPSVALLASEYQVNLEFTIASSPAPLSSFQIQRFRNLLSVLQADSAKLAELTNRVDRFQGARILKSFLQKSIAEMERFRRLQPDPR